MAIEYTRDRRLDAADDLSQGRLRGVERHVASGQVRNRIRPTGIPERAEQHGAREPRPADHDVSNGPT